MTENIIEIRNLVKSYKLYNKPFDRVREAFSVVHRMYSSEKKVLNNITINITSGDVVGIVGTNGAGKSTLLKIITGVLTPSSGEIVIRGKIAALLELGAGFNPEFTGIKNIFLNGTMMGFSQDEMQRKLQSIIDFADIGDFINRPVKIYSSGMFARLAFAVAINVEPDILIVDEVLSVGDLRFQMKCMDKMKAMMDSGVTVLFVSHDINAIRRLCTKGIWLKDGEIKSYGEINRVCDQYMDYLKLIDIPEEESRGVDETIEQESAGNILPPFRKVNKDTIAEIIGVRFMDSDGLTREEINLFDPFILEIYYDVYDEEVENPVLGAALKRIDEEYICGVNTLLDKKKIPWTYGRNCYQLIYHEGLRVLGGRYYFDVAIFDKTATVPIHYCARVKEFSVTAPYIGEGVCILPHEWRPAMKSQV